MYPFLPNFSGSVGNYQSYIALHSVVARLFLVTLTGIFHVNNQLGCNDFCNDHIPVTRKLQTFLNSFIIHQIKSKEIIAVTVFGN